MKWLLTWHSPQTQELFHAGVIGMPPLWPLVLKHDLRAHFIRHGGSKLRGDCLSNWYIHEELITCTGPCIGNRFWLAAIGIQKKLWLELLQQFWSINSTVWMHLKSSFCDSMVLCNLQQVNSLHFLSGCWSVFLALVSALFLLEPKWAGREAFNPKARICHCRPLS